MTVCYVGIGSNLGNRERNIEMAIDMMGRMADSRVVRTSSIYETEPVSNIPQGKYLNGVVEIETGLEPRSLLKELNAIEKDLGRSRKIKDEPRTIDLDILYYGDIVMNEDAIMIPHPRIQEREFVLKGLRELGVG